MQYAQHLEEVVLKLRARWDKLLLRRALGPHLSDVFITSTGDFLSKYYVEQEWRRYTTFFHLERMLEEFDKVKDQLKHPEQVEFALFLYKSGYRTDVKYSERRSVVIARRWLMLMGASEYTKRKIKKLILVSNKHPKMEKARLSIDEKYMSDFDLYDFSLSWDRMLGQSRDIRREFAHVSDEEFRKMYGRYIMKMMGNRIYHSTYYSAFEANAKENMLTVLKNMNQIALARPTDKRL